MTRLPLALIACLLLGVPAACADARADLAIRHGHVEVRKTRLKGSFRVVNRGSSRTRAFVVGMRAGSKLIVRYHLTPLAARSTRTVRVDVAVPSRLPWGRFRLRVCAGKACAAVGTLKVPASAAEPAPTPAPSASVTPAPTTSASPSPSPSAVPSDPMAFKKDTPIAPGDGRTYWTYVPKAYDASNQTPMPLLIWLHGCGGHSSNDISTVSPGGTQTYLAIAVDGREGTCWDVSTDQRLVLDALANVRTHFNVDAHHVVLGGFSSGGDLAYRTIFYNANTFAGLLAENTLPFRDTGSSAADSIAAASWRFNVVHLAHTSDEFYAIDQVHNEIGQLQAAGFPVTFVERPGTHEDASQEADLQQILLPHMRDAWSSP